jgi:hypothetical protein
MSRVTQHSVPRVLTQDQRDDRMCICSDLIDSADKYGMFLNRIITGDETWCFLVWLATEETVGHLEITIIAKKAETAIRQVKRQGKTCIAFITVIILPPHFE